MHCLSLPLFKKSYSPKDVTVQDFIGKYQPIDDFQKERGYSVQKSGYRGERRYAVLWEQVENSGKSIPVFVKSTTDREHIKTAIERDEFLSKVIFGKRLQKVVDAMYMRDVKAKEKIIKEGEAGKYMYIIAEGKFEVSTEEKGTVTILNVGRAFGELAILYNHRRQATVKALIPGKVWVLDRQIYQTIVKRFIVEEKAEKLRFLQECPILNKVNQDVLAKVAELLKMEYFPTGKTIIRQGDPAEKFYIITAGSVAITIDTEGLKGYLYKGNCFGERAILSESARQATVIACDTGVECLTLARQHFLNHFGDIEDISEISIPKQPQIELKPKDYKRKYRKLKSSEFKILQTIGEGGFGRVELIQHKKDPSITFALKLLKRVDMVKDKQQQHVMNEKEIQMACESPFIVKLYKTDKDKKYLYFWLEMCLGGEIYKWLKSQPKQRFDEKIAKFIAGCLLEALNYLHDRGVIYRDIKPENLLVDQRGYVKLGDFGFAKKLNSGAKTATFAGTPEYVAPEIISSREYDRGVDFWELGILIFELLNGRSPFAANSDLQIYRNIEKGFHKVKIPSHFTDKAANLIGSLLRDSPEERLGYQIGGHDKIRSHPWFAGFNWDKLRLCEMTSPIRPTLRNNIDLRYMQVITRKPIIPKDDTTHYFDDF